MRPPSKTPVLFLHGIEDYRCTCDHSLQLHSAITYFGGVSRVFAFFKKVMNFAEAAVLRIGSGESMKW